ncbi:hypothetical protein CEXT_189411 [Caerostris extrusa]|uniref:Uncharacterized protein n=1 Tax=Caerostris extrusa TaxID=172846 RepID=A0AAV4SA89_CAEEX|nr:hypothetical protein CEXT_189411 [Caerostris extrusa]
MYQLEEQKYIFSLTPISGHPNDRGSFRGERFWPLHLFPNCSLWTPLWLFQLTGNNKGRKKSNWTRRELVNWPRTEFLDVKNNNTSSPPNTHFRSSLTTEGHLGSDSGHFIYSPTTRYGLRYGCSNSREIIREKKEQLDGKELFNWPSTEFLDAGSDLISTTC